MIELRKHIIIINFKLYRLLSIQYIGRKSIADEWKKYPIVLINRNGINFLSLIYDIEITINLE